MPLESTFPTFDVLSCHLANCWKDIPEGETSECKSLVTMTVSTHFLPLVDHCLKVSLRVETIFLSPSLKTCHHCATSSLRYSHVHCLSSCRRKRTSDWTANFELLYHHRTPCWYLWSTLSFILTLKHCLRRGCFKPLRAHRPKFHWRTWQSNGICLVT